MRRTILFYLICSIFSLTAKGQVCEIDGTPYNTFADALTAVTDGQTITLLANITHNSPVDLEIKAITFNFNGHDLTIDVSATPGSTALKTGGDLIFLGSGNFTATGDITGIDFTGISTQTFTVGINNVTIQTTSAGAGTAGIVSSSITTDIKGRANLNIYASGTSGDGIRLSAMNAILEMTVQNTTLGFKFIIRGAGSGHGLNFTTAGNHSVTANIGYGGVTSIFSGGNTGNGLNSPGMAGELSVSNLGNGHLRFLGGNTSGNGIYTKSNLYLDQVNSIGNNSSFSIYGEGTGCGIKLDNSGRTLTTNKVTVSGGSAVPAAPGQSAGLWLEGSTTMNINAGLSPSGGSGGGPGVYVNTDGATLTISAGAQSNGLSPTGQKVIYGYGIYAAGALTLAKSGSNHLDVKAHGGNDREGIFIGGGKDLTLTGDITVEANGGYYAKGFALSGAGKVNFTDQYPKLIISNKSASDETVLCSKTSTLLWTSTGDGYISTGNEPDNAVTYTIPAYSETSQFTTIYLSTGEPSIITRGGNLTPGYIDAPYNLKLTATHYPTSWTVISGALPAGLSIGNNGVISGTPTVTGYYTFAVTATNIYGTSAPVTFYISIQDYVGVYDIVWEGLYSFKLSTLPQRLSASYEPWGEATFKDIVWSIESAGTTGATVSPEGDLDATAAGKVTVRATIINGYAPGIDFTKDFEIKITDKVCEIDGVQYEDLDEALRDVEYNTPTVIKLLDDITYYDRLSISFLTITFDLNGFDLTFISGESGLLELINSHIDYVGEGNFIAKTGQYGYCVVSMNGENTSCAMTKIEINEQGITGIISYGGTIIFTGDIYVNAEDAKGVEALNCNLTINGNIIASEGIGISVYSGTTVTVEGILSAPDFIYINGFPFNVSDKSPESSKPGYDEYTDSDCYVWVKTQNVIMWLGVSDEWNGAQNWSSGQVPASTDVVFIPRLTEGYFYPVLTDDVTVGEIHFEPGSQIGNQHLLEGKAFVQYDLNRNNRWQMLSMPLGEAYPGDFTFGGYPETWVRTFEVRPGEGSLTKGVWVTARQSKKLLSYGDGFVLWVNDFSKYDKGLTLLNGIRELPFFQHHATGSPDKRFYENIHHTHDYSNGESTFYEYLSDGGGGFTRGSNNYSVTRSENAPYQLMRVPGEYDPYTINIEYTNNEQVSTGNVTLIGNPFMACLNIGSLYEMNNGIIKYGYHVWDGNGYLSYGLGGPFGLEINSPQTELIAPLQAFLVEKPDYNEENELELRFFADMAVTFTDFEFRSSPAKENKLDIVARNPVAGVRTYIAKREGGQDTFGNSDMRKIINTIGNVPEIYTLKKYKGGLVATGANIINSDDLLIPVGLATSYTGNITLSFSGMDSYNANLSLIDAETGRSFDLTGLASYDYVVDYTPRKVNNETVPCENRFFIRISKSATGLTETLAGKVNVYESNGQIRIISGASNPVKEVAVYDLQGALVYKAISIQAITHTVDLNQPAGVYVVKVVTEKGVDNVKVVKN